MTITVPSRDLFRSPAVQVALTEARAAIAEPGCVLICGEPGTGRTTFAKAIHRATNGDPTSLEELLCCGTGTFDSPAPFVVVGCATTRDVEALLFGGCASTHSHPSLESISAHSLLHRARHGTLFLHTAQDLPGRIQNRLARVLADDEVWLDDGELSRVVAVQARVIASVDAVPTGAGDLLVPELKKRLAVHRIELPPLRRRREDVPGFVRLLVAEICALQQMPAKKVSSQAASLLSALPWRGNLAELRELVRTLVAKVPGRMIRVSDVLTHVRFDARDITFSGSGTLKEARERFERDYVAAVLQQHQGRMAEAARVLGMQRTNLYRKVRQLAVARAAKFPQAAGSSARKTPHDPEMEGTIRGTARRAGHSVRPEEGSMEIHEI